MANIFQAIKALFISNHVVSAEYKSGIMTVTHKNGEIELFKGSCTVWHKLPYMTRCNTPTESWLCEMWHYNKEWGGAWPNAHLPKV